MRAGRLDRRIVLEAPVTQTDGDPSLQHFEPQATVYAEKMEKSQLTRFVSDQTLAEAARVYRVRYRTDVNPTWRVKDDETYWRVSGVAEGDGRRTETLIACGRYDPNDREYE